jgi:hypothetical protein
MNKVLKVKSQKAVTFYIKFICMMYNLSGDAFVKFLSSLYKLQTVEGELNDELFIKKSDLTQLFSSTQVTYDRVKKDLEERGIIETKKGHVKLSRQFFSNIGVGSSIKVEIVD